MTDKAADGRIQRAARYLGLELKEIITYEGTKFGHKHFEDLSVVV